MKPSRIFALGFFDGVHLGHQALLRECVRLASEYGAEPAAITFDAHPRALFEPEPPKLLTALEDRKALLEQYGIRYVQVLPVTDAVMSTPWEDFLENLRRDGAAGFVCGHDFRFGFRGQGNGQKLLDYCAREGLPCTVIPEQVLEGVTLSSSHIRILLEAGAAQEAARFLGHPHIISGEVTQGRKIGRTIGVPTANLKLPEGQLCPRLGVYAAVACFGGQRHIAVANIGSRPTVGGRHVTVEPWILDYAGDLYGREITLEFYYFIRPEQKFPDLEALKAEIHRNAEETRAYLQTTLTE